MGASLFSGIRILVTSAGTAPGLAAIRALSRAGATVFAADESAFSPGLYLVPGERRIVLSPPDAEAYASELLRESRSRCVSVVIPAEGTGLAGLAAERERFEACGVSVLCPSEPAARLCLDRLRFHERVRGRFPTPETFAITSASQLSRLPRPFELEGRFPESGLAPALCVERPAHFGGAGRLSLVARHLAPGGSLLVTVLGHAAARGGVRASVVVEELPGMGGAGTRLRVLPDDPARAMAEAAYDELELDGLVTFRVVRDARGAPELVSASPFVPATVGLMAAAGRDLLGAAVASLLGIPFELSEAPPERLLSVSVAEELIVPAEAAEDELAGAWRRETAMA